MLFWAMFRASSYGIANEKVEDTTGHWISSHDSKNKSKESCTKDIPLGEVSKIHYRIITIAAESTYSVVLLGATHAATKILRF